MPTAVRRRVGPGQGFLQDQERGGRDQGRRHRARGREPLEGPREGQDADDGDDRGHADGERQRLDRERREEERIPRGRGRPPAARPARPRPARRLRRRARPSLRLKRTVSEPRPPSCRRPPRSHARMNVPACIGFVNRRPFESGPSGDCRTRVVSSGRPRKTRRIKRSGCRIAARSQDDHARGPARGPVGLPRNGRAGRQRGQRVRPHPAVQGAAGAARRVRGAGFTVLGFPSNDFGAQEPGTPEQIRSSASATTG